MGSHIKHSNDIHYELGIQQINKTLSLCLNVRDKFNTKTLKTTIEDQSSKRICGQFSSIDSLYDYMKNQQNLRVDPICGKIHLQNNFTISFHKEKQNINHKNDKGKNFQTQITQFESEMKKWKQNLQTQLKVIKTEEIPWQLQLANGKKRLGKYIGQVKDAKPNGLGVLIFDDRDNIEAEWKDGVRHGKVIGYSKNGDVQEYEMMGGKLHGKRITLKQDGSRWEWSFQNGLKNGKIRCLRDGRVEYQGEYRDDEQITRIK